MDSIYRDYASLLIDYCLDVKPGQHIFVRSGYLAEPLLREIYREILLRGARYDAQIAIQDEDRIFHECASSDRYGMTPVERVAFEKYDALCTVRAPFNLKSLHSVGSALKRKVQEGLVEQRAIFHRRSAEGSLRWVLCEFPTPASAQECGMSLGEYEDFIFKACKLDTHDPVAAWKDLSASQDRIVSRLSAYTGIRYVSAGTDISFSVKGRKWMNSDGKRNMPSGEIYTSPVEDSVNGKIRFSFPAVFMGEEVEGVSLEVKDGLVVNWSADRGRELLDEVFKIEGSRRFGEAAIGMNEGINRFTKNILFDEKTGGTIHMAIGASYPETGGKNESSLHWDLINDMRDGGKIFADGVCVYENGRFVW